MTSPHIVIVLGTRPEIIKLAPVIRECEQRNVQYSILHTGQHYSENLDEVFFTQLELPAPDFNLEIGSDSHGQQTGSMLMGIESILLEEKPDYVIVLGDTNSTLAGSLATSKLDPMLVHVEAGLRSFNRDMPEEINRVLTDHASDLLCSPTERAKELLHKEGIPDERLLVTGNPIVDAVHQHRELAEKKSDILGQFGLTPETYVVMTAHRAENVDDPVRFENMLNGVAEFATTFGRDVVYPIHPRAQTRLNELDMKVPESLRLVEPLDFLDFLKLEDNAEIILTDSGGVQEEACILRTPCVTLRNETERPETIDVGANRLAGVDSKSIVSEAEQMRKVRTDWTNPFGDGTAAVQIVDAITQHYIHGEVPLRELTIDG